MIELLNLTRRFGKTVAIDNLNLTIAPGAVVGWVGPTGSGKTTLLQLLAGVLPPSAGDALLFDVSVAGNPARARALTGYLPSDPGMYPDLSCADYLRFFAECQGVPTAQQPQLVADLLQLVDLHHRRDDLTDTLTLSMRKRLGLARALTHDPQILLLDDALNGLDPRARVEIRALLADLSTLGKTILLTATRLADIEDVCTNAVLLTRGQITDVVDLSEPRPRGRMVLVRYLGDPAMAERLSRGCAGVLDITHVTPAAFAGPPERNPMANPVKEMNVLFGGSFAEASQLLRALMHSGVQVVAFGEGEGEPA
jgi:ABC-2 type transport system ATP-binding protein